MQLRSIETTPSPHCIKLNLNEVVSTKALTLTQGATKPDAPAFAQQLLAIESVQSVFLFQDFITLTRQGNADWQPILAKAAGIIGVAKDADKALLFQVTPSQITATSANSTTEQLAFSNFGSVEVAVQMFRAIPIQVRAISADGQQARVALPDRFNQALQRTIVSTGANYVAERRWEPYQSPAGSPDEVARVVADEIADLIDEDELARIEASAISNHAETKQFSHTDLQQSLLTELQYPNWKHRLKALQQIEVNPETLERVLTLLNDEQSTIRRWAAALVGASGMTEVVEPLCQVALIDPSAIVRRTAGDALSDLGDVAAMATMTQALTDHSKLMRWRAARFLNELGDRSAVMALQQAIKSETEFDVRLEMMAALERIEGDGDTLLPMWQRITQGIVNQ
ncbi:virulence factor [Chlorogloea sp. CCALA 695]|uniref:virulence factor n=1 Tax=Chlorogloea sp. CCALA 695 TaxID=2107693 RepID=UPI000D04CB44|nr:virulence factor [Chlorogloea sp. CCALA 695]PSB26912.1 PBS lyase [Chlorogloea sp. CCALA 695]